KPGVASGNDPYFSATFFYHAIHKQRNEILGLRLFVFFFEEVDKHFTGDWENRGIKSPEVHRRGRLRIHNDVTARFTRYDLTVLFHNLRAFHYGFQVTLGIPLTTAARHAAVVRQEIFQCITDERMCAFRVFCEVLRYGAKSFSPVEVVSVNHRKGFRDHILCAQHGAPGTPGFLTFRIPEYRRCDLVKRLNNKINFDTTLQAREKHFFYRFLYFIPYDEHDLGE